MQNIRKSTHTALDFIFNQILDENTLKTFKENESLSKAVQTYKKYILNNTGLLTFKRENPYYYTLIAANIILSNSIKNKNKYRLCILELSIQYPGLNEIALAKLNKIIKEYSTKYNIDLSDSSDELTDYIINSMKFKSEADYIVAVIDEHLKITKLNKKQKDKYQKIIDELSLFILNDDDNKANITSSDLVNVNENQQDLLENKKECKSKKTKTMKVNKKDTGTKIKKSKSKIDKPSTDNKETDDELSDEEKLNKIVQQLELKDIANLVDIDSGYKVIAIREEGKSSYVMSKYQLGNYANMLALNEGIANKLRSKLKIANKERDVLSKLTMDKSSPIYNSVVYDIRLYKNILEKITLNINSYTDNMTARLTKLIKLTGIKSVELKTLLENSDMNYDAITLKILSESLLLMSSLLTMKNTVTTDDVVENNILKTELEIIYTTLGKIINNIN